MTNPAEYLDRDPDESYMRMALDLAARGQGAVEPNPMVGCVIVRRGQQIGQGYHRQFGGDHAEIEALHSLASESDAQGATAYVTLEPCCHQGKTPPCADALIRTGIARVVLAMPDPFPRVAGGGIKRLTDAGIDVRVGVLEAEARDLCAPYLKKVCEGKPWFIAKWAMTIDGKIATSSGESQWITGTQARTSVHQLRSRVDGIVVGMGTVAADNPRLTARLDGPPPQRIATRIVFCRQRTPSVDSNLMQTAAEVPVMIFHPPTTSPESLAALRSMGAKTIETISKDPVDMIPLAAESMADNQMTNVMIEGGSNLLGSFLSADQIDECHVYLGAKAVGGDRSLGPIGGSGISQITSAWRGKLRSVYPFDDDLLAIYRRV